MSHGSNPATERRRTCQLALTLKDPRTYNYSATQNNGQIVSQQDLVNGEIISYQYDSLKRLVQASAAGDLSGSWSQNFAFDGFGNLTNRTSTNAPQLNVAVDWATNRIQSFSSYDANGNMNGYAGDGYSYDLQNRMIQATVSGVGTVSYGYDTTNHRIYKGGYNSGAYSAEEFYFYGVEGHKYGTWQINPSSGVLLQASVTKQWFGGRLVSPEDRLGSKGRYFAFGEERTNITPANPANDQEKFATYTRDAATGLDYANQRYFSSIIGRFTKPDSYASSAEPSNPQSWNIYTYTNNDPINNNDPSGLIALQRPMTDSPPLSGSGGGGGASFNRPALAGNDPGTGYAPGKPIGNTHERLKQYRKEIEDAVDKGLLSDCQALVGFISEAVEQLGLNGSQLAGELGNFVPAENAYVQMAGLPSVQASERTTLLKDNNLNVSGFLPKYQNSISERGVAANHLDQVHHFATFFELGFYGGIITAPIAYFIDTPAENNGDAALGAIAVQFGSVAANAVDLSSLVSQISQTLCDPNWQSSTYVF